MFQSLLDYIAGCRSLRVGAQPQWRGRQGIDSVVIVGSTCAGKTTLANAIRGSELACSGRVVVPVRYITRERRDNDDTIENTHISAAEFDARIGAGEIAMAWVRPMENGREVHYGFPAVSAQALPVYSGNNAMYMASTTWRAGALGHALLVGVYAPDFVRESRLRQRSPDLWHNCRDEVTHRLADRAVNMLPHVGVIIDNHGDLEETAPVEVVGLIEVIAGLANQSR